MVCAGCATPTPQTDRLMGSEFSIAPQVKLNDVPFIQQQRYLCGPATLAMVMGHLKVQPDLEHITGQTFTQGMQGTFQSEMISAVRRQGLLALKVSRLPQLLEEVAAGHPVIVFQNLGLASFPKWHYAVVTGHDLHGPDIILHSGEKAHQKMDMRLFERSWKLAGHWGLLIMNPDQLSVTASEDDHLAAAAMLETTGKLEAAGLAYQTILKRWPQSELALLGLGNTSFLQQRYHDSAKYFYRAAKLNPDSSIIWHNLALAQGAAGLRQQARVSSQKALATVPQDQMDTYLQSLRQWVE
jgi:tetratricopeptide (TPR) repeat protein